MSEGARGVQGADSSEAVEALYAQVCGSHDQIADFRAKLLGLLPLASGAGIFLLLSPDSLTGPGAAHLLTVGLFGAVVTWALFIYELRGIQKCLALIRSARRLESYLGGAGEHFGAFRSRPRPVGGRLIGVRGASRLIYSAVVGAWLYVASIGLLGMRAPQPGSGLDAAGLADTVGVATPAQPAGGDPAETRSRVPPWHAPAALLIAWVSFVTTMFAGSRILERQDRQMDESELSRLNRAMFTAEDDRDVKTMDATLSEGFWMVRSSDGEPRQKAEFLDEVAKAPRATREVVREQIEKVTDSCAIVSSVLKFQRPEDPAASYFWNTKVFVKHDGEWRCRAWQVTRRAKPS